MLQRCIAKFSKIYIFIIVHDKMDKKNLPKIARYEFWLKSDPNDASAAFIHQCMARMTSPKTNIGAQWTTNATTG